ncbi:MAG: hypothetical protein GF398_14095 [Chitinivibrionales bacterium]|nr:hypothetical protein [Chitinivibrionales bacterium]
MTTKTCRAARPQARPHPIRQLNRSRITASMRAAEALPHLLRNAAFFLYPPVCLLCSTMHQNYRWLCASCLNTLRTSAKNRSACPRCSINKQHHLCACESAWDYDFEKIIAVWDFDDALQKIMHEIKYQDKKSLARSMGALAAGMLGDSSFSSIQAIVPVPLFFLRLMKRGYNQSLQIAHGLTSALPNPPPLLASALRRVRHTRTQTKLDKAQRGKNLHNAFQVSQKLKPQLKAKHVLLVDDVITTGATTSECTRVLLQAGCSKVTVFSLARA